MRADPPDPPLPAIVAVLAALIFVLGPCYMRYSAFLGAHRVRALSPRRLPSAALHSEPPWLLPHCTDNRLG
jgi:hypothetical protein